MSIFFLATSNEHKVKEFSSILVGHQVIPVQYSNVVENEKTYAGNSMIKLNALLTLYKMTGGYKDEYIFLADDSGLEIEALGNRPGVFSARFLSDMTQKEKNEYIVSEVAKAKNNNAKFVCCLSFSVAGKTHQVISECRGRILTERQNIAITKRDFGYDPIFIPNGYNLPYNLLPESIKLSSSHRALACINMLSELRRLEYLDKKNNT